MGQSTTVNISSGRLSFTQEDFSGGINNVDQTAVIKDNSVKLSKNFDLTIENRLEKRKGLIYKFDAQWRANFEKEHPEFGTIMRPIEGTIQGYHTFVQNDGTQVEFWVINGKIYKYPFIFGNAANGVLWDVLDENNIKTTFKIEHREKFDILTTRNQVIFLTGQQILEYTPYTDDAGIESDDNYVLRFIKPYSPLLQEFQNVKYGQNNLVKDKLLRSHFLNTDLLGKNGFLGLMTDPNILYPRSKPFGAIPIINQEGLPEGSVMATQLAMRVIGGGDGQPVNADATKLSTTERFGVPAEWDKNDGTTVDTIIRDTNQLEVLGTTFYSQGTSLDKIEIKVDETKNLVAFNSTAGNNIGVFKNADGNFDFYMSTNYDDIMTLKEESKLITWGADKNIASIEQVKTNKAGTIVVSYIKTDGTEETDLITSKGFGIHSIEWDPKYAFGVLSKDDWLKNVTVMNDAGSSTIKIAEDFSKATMMHTFYPPTISGTDVWEGGTYTWPKNQLLYTIKDVGCIYLWNAQLKSNYIRSRELSSSWKTPPPQSTWLNPKVGNSSSKLTTVKNIWNLDGSFELTTSFEVNYTYLWGSNRYGYASTTQDGIKVSGEALQFLTDPTNPNSELVTIDAVNKPYYFDKHLSSFDTIAGLEDALNAGTYGFAMSEVVLYKGKPIIQQIDNSTFVIALYNTSSKFKNTEVITSDLGSKEFIYFAKINVYNLLSDPTVINDKFAAKSFAYLDEGTLLYTDKQGRIWDYIIDGNTTNLRYESTALPFSKIVENTTNSIIAINDKATTSSLYRIDNTNWNRPTLLWVDDLISAITKSTADAGTWVYLTGNQLKTTSNWRQSYTLSYEFDSEEQLHILQAWELKDKYYGFVIADNNNSRWYGSGNITDSQYLTYPVYTNTFGEWTGDKKTGDRNTEQDWEGKFLNTYGKRLVNKILIGTNGATDTEVPAAGEDPGCILSFRGKFPDYTDYVELFTVEFGDDQYHPEYQYLMFEMEALQIVLIAKDGYGTSNPVKDFWISCETISDPTDTKNYMSTYETIWTPQLSAVTTSENINYIHECKRGYYKNGYLMIYGRDDNNLANKGNTIFISSVDNANYFPQYNTIDIMTEGSEKIQSITSWNSQIENVIFMENSIYYLKFPDPLNAELRMITNAIGLNAPYSIANASNKLFFASYNGVYALTNVSYATDGSANFSLVSEKITPLLLNTEGVIDKNSIGYVVNNNYYLIVPNVMDYDVHENQVNVYRRFKYYTGAGKQCWYMDESPYLDICMTTNVPGNTEFIMNGIGMILHDDKEIYLDGNFDEYYSLIPDTLDPNTEIKMPDDPTFYIYPTQLITKGYTTDYKKHTKNFRKALVELGIGKQNVHVGIGSEVDGYTKLNPSKIVSTYRNGHFEVNEVVESNFDLNAGTIIGTLKENGTFVWNTSKWGWKQSGMTMVSSFKRGLNISIIVEQVANEPSPYQILTVGFEYRVRNLRKQN
jgi:hypothetical protein